MKTIADFKRTMVPGTFWESTHEYIGEHPTPPKDFGVRECVLANTVNFALLTEKANGEKVPSYSMWPAKKEFSVRQDGAVVIEKAGFVRLIYKQVEK